MNTPRTFDLPRPGPTANAGDFVDYARALMQSRGVLSNGLQLAEQTMAPRVANILRAAVSAGTTTDPDWAGALSDYRTAETAFVESLKATSAFDAILPSMRRAPLRSRVVVSSTALVASEVAEGAPKPVGQLSFLPTEIPVVKAALILVVSRELAETSAAAGMALISAELRAAVSAGSDAAFVAALSAGLTPIAASGTDAAAVAADLRAALEQITTSAASRLFAILPSVIAKRLMTMSTADGALAFPEMSVNGGTLCGLSAVVSSAMSDAEVLVLDASQIIAAADPITLDSSNNASLIMDSDPQPGAALVSLWQRNLTGLRGERLLSVKPLTDTCAVLLGGVAWGTAP